MPTIVQKLCFALGDLPSSSVSPFIVTKAEFDYAIGGIPFCSAVDGNKPLQRETAPYRKDQFDNGQDPGEQSIVTWWLRSQSSFHGGAGLDYEIPYNYFQPRYETRFADSRGVDVWTPGKVTLLPSCPQNLSAAGAIKVIGVTDANGVDAYLQAEGNTLKKVLAGGGATALTWGGSNTIVSLATDGAKYYAADSVGIWSDTVPTAGAGAGAKVWNTGTAAVVIAFVKQRLMAAVGPSIYELVGGAPPALPTANYTHPVAGWTWTAFAEGPAAIYAAGYSGAESTLMKLTLSSSGSVPTLTSATEVWRAPRGEIITGLFGYGGTFLVIGTNRGVRIGILDTNGNVAVGGLSVKTTNAVNGFAAKDRFVFCAGTNELDGNSGVFRIDLQNNQNDFGLFSYATDLQTHVAGNVSGLTWLGRSGRLVVPVDSHGSYLQSATLLESSGWLTTERIRFHTLDAKLFKFIHPRLVAPINGNLAVSQIDDLGNARQLTAFGASDDVGDVSIAGAIGPQEFMQFKFTLTPNGGATAGPELHGYQVKALPAAKRQRQFTIPLNCYDVEKDHNGIKFGYEKGFALARLQALEELEEAGDTVLFQDLVNGESRLVVIDAVKYVQTAPSNNQSGNGGILMVQLRAVT